MKRLLFSALMVLMLSGCGLVTAAGLGTYIWPGGPDVAVAGISTLGSDAYRRWHACSGGPYTVTLPTGQTSGMIGFRLAPTFTGSLTISPASGNIDNAATKTLVANDTCTIVWDGTRWQTTAFFGSSAASAITSGTLLPARGGTGVSNTGTFTNASNSAITGGGTIALGGFTATVPATGTVGVLNSNFGGAVVASDLTVNNTTTLTNVTGMSFSVVSGGQYVVRCAFDVATDNNTDIKFTVTGPTCSTFLAFGTSVTGAGGPGNTGIATATAIGTEVVFVFCDVIPNHTLCYMDISFTATSSATLQIKYAQYAAVATNTTIKAGSTMTWMRTQ